MLAFLHCFACIFIALLLSFRTVSSANGGCQTLFVDKSGRRNFSTIQSAINHVPSNNQHWFCISISAGTYREKVSIPYDKPFIVLKGAGKRKTWVVWDDHSNLQQSPTFASLADHIVVKSMTFVNSYNSPSSKNPKQPAAAALISGDKSFFFRCGFSSLQDTLWDNQGRHYFKRCTIEGAIDFILGAGQSIYEDSVIRYLGNQMEPHVSGYITAQARGNPNDANGFVFKNCRVVGSGTTNLGRAWRTYARVLFYNCTFSNIVEPLGWNAWNAIHHEDKLTFAEYGNQGPGSDTSHRVKWEKKLSAQAVMQLTSMSYIDNEGWLQNQPLKI